MVNYDIIQRMRDNLQPRGTAPVVQLHLAGYGMFHKEFVDKCIDELERMHIRVALGDMPSNLEKLAYELLKDSAYIDIKAEEERQAQLEEYAKEANETRND